MNTENRNLILAILLSIGILLGFNYFFEPTKSPEKSPILPSLTDSRPHPVVKAEASTPILREEALSKSIRIPLKTPNLQGSISLKGGRVDDIKLVNYHETVNPQSPEIILFSPFGTKNPYFAEFGWVSSLKDISLPNSDTDWKVQGTTLTPDSPLILTWDNGHGLLFERIISVDDQYLFTITDRVENKGSSVVSLHPYGLISRGGTPPVSGYYALYEGPIGVLNGSLNEISYEDISKKNTELSSIGGWIGMTDKYWLSALIPDPNAPLEANFKKTGLGADNTPIYQVDFLGTGQTLAVGSYISTTHRLFAGAKVVTLLDAYETTLNVPKFDRAVDFGWFYLITKPLFYALTFINTWVQNFGGSILILTVLVKLLFLPLANKSYKAMARMKRLQPDIAQLQERYKDDKVKQNQELMAFYKRHRVNPMAGCLPLVIQIPVFFALYKVLFISLEMRHAPFFAWVGSAG